MTDNDERIGETLQEHFDRWWKSTFDPEERQKKIQIAARAKRREERIADTGLV